MKFSAIFLSAAALAVSAVAEPVSKPESHVARDVAAVESAITQIKTGIQTLTKSVADFNGDSIQVEADASALATTIELSIDNITSSGNLDVAGLAGLTTCFTGLADASKDLITKLTVKKNQFEEAGLCGTVEKLMANIGDQSISMIKAVSSLLPEQLQGTVQTVGQGITDLIVQGAATYSENNCVDNPAANTSKSLVPYPTGSATFSAIAPIPTTKTSTMQVTITTCPEGQAVTQTSISIVKPTTSFTPSYLPSTSQGETMVIPPVPTVASSTQLITAGPEPTFSSTFAIVVPSPTVTRPAQSTTSIPIAAGPRNMVSGASLVAAAGAVFAAMLL